ncbi:hypothetical protein EYC80_002364 [Monilinia laxa]|uniref:Uncharacterized protein n=1 Tax=Monilinia laxa TaxID=61186 RepID=A0A5N6K3K5_MONLA|nr:hypothetical protein EYC80_002364 [Monilinia laxa]
MTDYSTKTIPNGFLSPPTETEFKDSQRRRSASVPSSERSAKSNLSRITLVEDNAPIAKHTSLEDSDSIISSNYSCLDHLVAIFRIMLCMPASKKMKIRPTGIPKSPSSDMDGSPWVLPVLVLSSRRDTDKQPVPKRAKCTIDTGNMQGNIVSREFVEKVLEYPESNFVPLTVEEKEGGFGVTGHKLVPEGAIYLTWYHSKSTRVFHKMRFLISPHSQCDLIIGARSIQKDNLLGVPNLMATTSTRIANQNAPSMDKEEEHLETIWLKRKESFMKKEVELMGAGVDFENDQDWKDLRNTRDVAEMYHLIRKAEVAGDQKKLAQLKTELETLPGYKTYIVPSALDTTSSGRAKQSESIPTQRITKTTAEASSSNKK